MKTYTIYYIGVNGRREFVAAMTGWKEAETRLEELKKEYTDLRFVMVRG